MTLDIAQNPQQVNCVELFLRCQDNIGLGVELFIENVPLYHMENRVFGVPIHAAF